MTRSVHRRCPTRDALRGLLAVALSGTAAAADSQRPHSLQRTPMQVQVDGGPARRSAIDLANDPDSFIAKCEVTATQSCDYTYLRNNLPAGKTQWFVIPGGDTHCIDATSPFGFSVFLPPNNAAGGPPAKLMLFFHGGGACFDYETCVTMPTASRAVMPETEGYFNYELESNPLRTGNWAAVTVGYCSGDMHVGNAAPELVSAFDDTLRETVHFSGYNNTMSVMDWVRVQPEFYSEADGVGAVNNLVEVVGSGCSAGSLGVQLWADYLVREMGMTKLQPDSYLGMLPPGANIALNIWNTCTVGGEIGILSVALEQQCTCVSKLQHRNLRHLEKDDYDYGEEDPKAHCLHEMPPIMDDFYKNNPTIQVAYTGSEHDMVQIAFYALLEKSFGENSATYATAHAMEKFPFYQMDALRSYKEASDTGLFSDYIVDTTEHCFVNTDAIFQSQPGWFWSTPPSPMAQFVSDFLNDDASVDRTLAYPATFPRSWHLACNAAEGADGTARGLACGQGFPPGDDAGAPTAEQVAWLQTDDAQADFKEYLASF